MGCTVVGRDHTEVAQYLFVVVPEDEGINIFFPPQMVLPVGVNAADVLDVLLHLCGELVGRLPEEDLMHPLGDGGIFVGDMRKELLVVGRGH